MMLTLRRFNEQGIKAFIEYLEALKASPAAAPPMELLDRPTLTLPLDKPIQVEPRPFTNRLDFAQWLDAAAVQAQADIPATDPGFWSWLSLALFDQVCPPKNGRRKVGERARYIPAFTDWKRRYRHLLANSYSILQIHKADPARSLVVLGSELHKPGEIYEQFASRLELISCPGVMGLATLLFVDMETQTRKAGASGKAARRLGKLLNQYMRTWDVAVMEPASAAKLLPKEFRRFISEEAQADAAAP